MTRLARLRLLVVLLVAGAAIYQVGAARDTILKLQGRLQATQSPFGGRAGSFDIGSVKPEAEMAGLRPGDRLLAIEGVAMTGRGDLAAATAWKQPGDELRVTTASAGEVAIRLEARSGLGKGAIEWIPAIILSIAMPWLCLILGGWVGFARPGDRQAWLLMAMMLSFGQATGSTPFHWPGFAGVLGVGWQSLTQVLWPAFMLLFALYFPERLPFDRRAPWAKWLLIGPLAAFAAASSIVTAISVHSLSAVGPLERWLAGFGSMVMMMAMASIGLFFAAMGYKSGTLGSPDARRRARVLVVGAQVGLSPCLILVGPALIKRVGPGDIAPPWVTALLFSFLFIFPATLAYVVVVQRALDVRVVVRQGMQYALARGGVKVLRTLFTAGIIIGVVVLSRQPGSRNVDTVRLVATGFILLMVTGRGTEKMMGWIDRRFFREAYDSERILTELADQVVTLVDAGEIVRTVADRLSTSLHVPRVACLMAGPAGFQVVGAAAPAGQGSIEEGASLPADGAIFARLRDEGGPVRTYLDDPLAWVNREGGAGLAEKAVLRALGTQLLIPLMAKGRMPGILSLSAKQSDEAYSATDLRLLRTVASQSALALENSRLTAAVATEAAHRERLNREVEIAREVQERLFPQRLPEVDGLDFAGACRPALGVGGDYYDFLALPGGRLGIAVGDVSGKGIGAALMMASLQASLRGQTMQGEGAVARVIANVNRLVYDASPDNRYATFFYAQYDPETRELTFVNAGHCPPMLLRHGRGNDGIERLEGGGTVVGLFETAEYSEHRVRLAPGDRIVAYTDGISEAFNKDDEEFGEDRLAEAALSCDGMPAAGAIERLMQRTDAFVAGAPQSDDMTIVILRLVR